MHDMYNPQPHLRLLWPLQRDIPKVFIQSFFEDGVFFNLGTAPSKRRRVAFDPQIITLTQEGVEDEVSRYSKRHQETLSSIAIGTRAIDEMNHLLRVICEITQAHGGTHHKSNSFQ